MAKGSAALRLGLGSGGGMSVTTCGGGEAEDEGATGIDGGASRAGAFGLRSGSGTTEVAAATSVCGVTVCTGASAGGVIAPRTRIAVGEGKRVSRGCPVDPVG